MVIVMILWVHFYIAVFLLDQLDIGLIAETVYYRGGLCQKVPFNITNLQFQLTPFILGSSYELLNQQWRLEQTGSLMNCCVDTINTYGLKNISMWHWDQFLFCVSTTEEYIIIKKRECPTAIRFTIFTKHVKSFDLPT